jgi:hypothetical protein
MISGEHPADAMSCVAGWQKGMMPDKLVQHLIWQRRSGHGRTCAQRRRRRADETTFRRVVRDLVVLLTGDPERVARLLHELAAEVRPRRVRLKKGARAAMDPAR